MTSNEDTLSGNKVDLHVRPVNGYESISMPKVWSVKRLPVSTRSAAPRCAVETFDYLADISVPEIDNNDVMLLIGSDNAVCSHSAGSTRRTERSTPSPFRSRLGWAIRGPLGADTEMNTASKGYHSVREVPQQQLERKWTIDCSEVTLNDKYSSSVEDEQTIQSTVSHEDVQENIDLSLPEVDKTAERDLYVDDSYTQILSEAIHVPIATDLRYSLGTSGISSY